MSEENRRIKQGDRSIYVEQGNVLVNYGSKQIRKNLGIPLFKKIKIFIASPSDVSKEREIAAEVIRLWNARNSDDRKIVLEPVFWESYSAPDSGDRVQGVLNKLIVDQCHCAIGIF